MPVKIAVYTYHNVLRTVKPFPDAGCATNSSATENLPRGIAKITPYGDPICLDGFVFDY